MYTFRGASEEAAKQATKQATKAKAISGNSQIDGCEDGRKDDDGGGSSDYRYSFTLKLVPLNTNNQNLDSLMSNLRYISIQDKGINGAKGTTDCSFLSFIKVLAVGGHV